MSYPHTHFGFVWLGDGGHTRVVAVFLAPRFFAGLSAESSGSSLGSTGLGAFSSASKSSVGGAEGPWSFHKRTLQLEHGQL